MDIKNIIIISMLHEPILSQEQDNISTLAKVDFVDPWDMSAPIYQIKYSPFQLVNLDELKSFLARPINESEEISPSEFMSLLGVWMNLDNDDLISSLCAELDNSVKYQAHLRGNWEEALNCLLDIMEQRPPCSPNSVLFPAHELQLPNIKEKFPYAKILPIDYSIQAYSQASLRTLVVPGVPGFAFKLALGIKVSSAMRTVSPWTTHTGPEFIPIFKKLCINKEILKIANAVATATVTEQNYDIAKHLSCIIREDFSDLNEKVIICAALTERDENGISVVEKVWKLDTEEKHTLFASTGLRANVLKDNCTEAKDLVEVSLEILRQIIKPSLLINSSIS
ncbi:8786_t:CDS:2, partial [Racocetra fulgida]